MNQLADIVELLVRAGFNRTAAVVLAILAAVVLISGVYAFRRWWAEVADRPLKLKLRAGNSKIKFVRRPRRQGLNSATPPR